MRILITGANGFIGAALYKYLQRSHNVIGTYHYHKPEFGNHLKVDLSNELEVNKILVPENLGEIEVIIHLASLMAGAGSLEDLEVINKNLSISRNIAKVAQHNKVKKIINLSSSAVYPNIDGIFDEDSIPNPSLNNDALYGISKLNSEQIINFFLNKTDVNILHLRTAIVYGHEMNNSRIIPVIIREIKEHNTITLFGNGMRLLNLISIEKLTAYISLFVKSNNLEGILNVGDECTSTLRLAEHLIGLHGNKNTKIILHAAGNQTQFVLNISKLKKIIKNV